MTESGKCITMTGAYKQSLQPKDSKDDRKWKEKAGDPDTLQAHLPGLALQETLRSPGRARNPVIAPPKVMRVLLLPYKGTDKELFMYRYALFCRR